MTEMWATVLGEVDSMRRSDGRLGSEVEDEQKAPRILSRFDAEAVADARLGVEIARTGRVRLDLVAQVGDVHAQCVGVLRVFRAPDPRQELAVGEDAVRVHGEVAERFDFSGGG